MLRIKTRWLVLAMAIAVLAVGALAYGDERARSEARLDDLGAEQASVADAAALAGPAAFAAFERDDARVVIVEANGRAHGLDGREVALPGLTETTRVVRIDRPDAAVLGLPERVAMAGVARLPDGRRLAIVRTASRQRDRDREGWAHLVLAMAVVTIVVLGFGGFALMRQRRQLAAERDAELEQLSRAATMAALGSGIAHELATPLGVIVGRAEQLLSRGAGDERIVKNAQAILDQADHVDRVVRGLLQLARGAPIALQETAPAELVRQARALVEHRFARAGVHLELGGTQGAPSVRCEPLLFEHALVNLLLNACDASPAGATVKLAVEPNEHEVAFVVTDDGDGITPADAARAIQPFFTTKPAGKGTGLGLAIANEIASTHRGSLAIGPREPRGTRAAITVPIGTAHA
ncbi:MAG TPA: HAMP domain-containing sensor histidine kinase [Kofleriaceae bacterium]|jgi:signal transduction histidine kinase|nr:HAMP domain-containing sensor histidine kinase [Kofleriaceae bacterium]